MTTDVISQIVQYFVSSNVNFNNKVHHCCERWCFVCFV